MIFTFCLLLKLIKFSNIYTCTWRTQTTTIATCTSVHFFCKYSYHISSFWFFSEHNFFFQKFRRNFHVRFIFLSLIIKWTSPVALAVRNLPINAGSVRDVCSTPGLGRSLRGRHNNPLHSSCLGNPMDRGTWWVLCIIKWYQWVLNIIAWYQ